MLQDLILAAVNGALKMADDKTNQAMNKLQGGMGGFPACSENNGPAASSDWAEGGLLSTSARSDSPDQEGVAMLRKSLSGDRQSLQSPLQLLPGNEAGAADAASRGVSSGCGKAAGTYEYLYFHLMGEPLLHPQLAELLGIAEELGFQVMITTNGTLLPERGAPAALLRAVHKVNLSLQSFEANAAGDLESYLEGCIGFCQEAAEQGILCEFRLWNQGRAGRQNRRDPCAGGSFPRPLGATAATGKAGGAGLA